MMNNNITFVIFTFNEERRIEYVLRCFKDYGRIIVIDNYSTDKTAEIAKKYGAEVYFYRCTTWAENEKEVEFVLNKVVTDWIYWGYVDELCPKTLLDKFVEISKQDKYKVVFFRRRNIHYGLRNLWIENAVQSRFFKKGAIDFKNNRIHGFGKIVCPPDKILHLPLTDEYSQYHFSTYNVAKFELSTSHYSNLEAQNRASDGKKVSLIKMILRPIHLFIRYYFVHGSWKCGMHGFVMTMQYCFFRFNVDAKTWEIENNVTLETIEQKYDKLKEELLSVQGNDRKRNE